MSENDLYGILLLIFVIAVPIACVLGARAGKAESKYHREQEEKNARATTAEMNS